MRLGYVVGALGRGGAELQLLHLAAGLVKRGHHVSVMAYDGPSVLDENFRESGCEVIADRSSTALEKYRSVRAWAKRSQLDVIQGILRRASTLAVITRWPARSPVIIATDYSSATYGKRSLDLWASLLAFRYADRVVTEVDVNCRSLQRLAPWLRQRTLVIRNGLDTRRFSPSDSGERPVREPFVFCAVGTLSRVKNPLRVLDAVTELRRRGRSSFRVDWYGRDALSARADVGEQARRRAADLGLSDHIVFHGEREDIEHAYHVAHALLHASVHEGFPNAVAEGMACGLPIVVSRVSDLPAVVAEARNGFVFDETDPQSIADAMERLMDLPPAERAAMGARSRELAVRWFGMERFIDEFEELYRQLAVGSR